MQENRFEGVSVEKIHGQELFYKNDALAVFEIPEGIEESVIFNRLNKTNDQKSVQGTQGKVMQTPGSLMVALSNNHLAFLGSNEFVESVKVGMAKTESQAKLVEVSQIEKGIIVEKIDGVITKRRLWGQEG